MADIAALRILVDASDADRAKASLDGLTGAGGRAEAVAGKLRSAFAQLGGVLGVGIGFRQVLRESIESQYAMAQLEAAVRSTGMAAGFTAQRLREQALALQQVTTFSHEAVEAAQAVLLLNENLKGVQFKQATLLAADLSARMGTDVAGAAKLLGRALQDPAMATMALNRAGLVFSMGEMEMMKQMMKAGDLAGAQARMLDLLTAKLAGSAVAARETLGGALAGLKNTLGDLMEVSKQGASGLIGTIEALTRALRGNAEAIRDTGLALGVMAGALTAVKVGGFLASVSGATAVLAALKTTAVGLVGFNLSAWLAGSGAAAATAATGFAALGTAVSAAALAAAPWLVLAGAFALLVEAIKNARREMGLIGDESAASVGGGLTAAGAPTRVMDAIAYRRAHGVEPARKLYSDIYGTGTRAGPENMGDTQKYDALIRERQTEVQRQTALNAAHDQGATALARLNAQYDAAKQRAEDAKEYRGQQLGQLNAITDAELRAKLVGIDLANMDAQLATKAEDATRKLTALADAQLAATRVGKIPEAAVAAENRDRQLTQLNAETDGMRRLAEARQRGVGAEEAMRVTLAGERAAREALTQAEQQSLVLTTKEVTEITKVAEAHEKARIALDKTTKDTTDKMDEGTKVMLRDIQRAFASFFQGLLEDGLSSFRSLTDAFRQMLDKMVANIAAAKLQEKMMSLVPVSTGGTATGSGNVGAGVFGGIAGFGVGYGLGHSIGGTGGVLAGTVGGAASGAMMGSMIAHGPGTLIGAAAGAIAGLVGGLLGVAQAARMAAEHFRALQDQLQQNLISIRAQVGAITQTEAALAQLHFAFEDLRAQANAALPGRGNEDERNRILDELNGLEAKRTAQLRAQAAAESQFAMEDLTVRMLRATGQDEAATMAALRLQHERERQDAVTNNTSETYRNTLALVQAAEETAALNGTLQDALRNTPAGFRVEGYTWMYREPRQDFPGTPPPVPPLPPHPIPDGGGRDITPMTVVQFRLGAGAITVVSSSGESPEDLARKVVRGIRSLAASTGGLNTKASRALDNIQ